MSYKAMDLESGPIITTTPLSPLSPNSLSALDQYQLLVGDVEKPTDANDDSLYHTIMIEERRSKFWYFTTATIMYFAILAQIVLCLGITIGAHEFLDKTQISILAAVNTAVAATIAVLKALGLPDKKGMERRKLQSLAARIRLTTRKLRAGLGVDAAKEAEDVEKYYEQAGEEAYIHAADATGSTKIFQKK